MSFPKVNSSNPHNQCCSEKVKDGAYGTAVTLVALAVIFGALVLLTQHYGLNWGPLNDPMKQVIAFLGNYTFVPLAASSGLLALLIVVGAVWKCPSPQAPEEQEPTPPPGSVFNLKEPMPNPGTPPNLKTGQPAKKVRNNKPERQPQSGPSWHSTQQKKPSPWGQISWGGGPIDLADPRLQVQNSDSESDENEPLKEFKFTSRNLQQVPGGQQDDRNDRTPNNGVSSGGFLKPFSDLSALGLFDSDSD